MKTAITPLRITTGTVADTGGASAATAIPVADGGNAPEQVLITVSEDTYVLAGRSTVSVANTTGQIVTPESGGVVMAVKGATHIAHLQVASAGRIAINPVES